MRMMKRFDAYLSRLCEVLGHADRDAPMREYCTGLMLPLKRKSVEPIAAHVGQDRQLPGGGERIQSKRADESAAGLPVVSAPGMGEGCAAAQGHQGAPGGGLRHQAADGSGATGLGLR